MAVDYVEYLYVIISLVGRSIWRQYHVCRFLVGDAKTFYAKDANLRDNPGISRRGYGCYSHFGERHGQHFVGDQR